MDPAAAAQAAKIYGMMNGQNGVQMSNPAFRHQFRAPPPPPLGLQDMQAQALNQAYQKQQQQLQNGGMPQNPPTATVMTPFQHQQALMQFNNNGVRQRTNSQGSFSADGIVQQQAPQGINPAMLAQQRMMNGQQVCPCGQSLPGIRLTK